MTTSLSPAQRQKLSILEGKKILILGAGREGLSTFNLLRKYFPTQPLFWADQRPLADLPLAIQDLIVSDPALTTHFGADYLSYLESDQIQVICKTPGIPASLPPLQTALAAGVELTSNTQLFFDLCPAQIIGVTGTKGKSTTSSLIHHVLHTNGLNTYLVGNIGYPPLNYLEEITATDYVVIELSSHQLAELHSSPNLAVIQDIQPEHLDYYPDFAAYVQAKSQITRFQTTADLVIFNDQLPQPTKLAQLSPGQKLIYNLQKLPRSHACCYFINQTAILLPDQILSSSSPDTTPLEIPLHQAKLKGRHNYANIAPALIIGYHFGLDANQLTTALNSFSPLPHRLQFIATRHQVDYYNDSMATTPEATIAALEAFAEQPVILLAGGSEKNANYHPLAQNILQAQVSDLILFPPVGARIQAALEAEFAQLPPSSTIKLPHFHSANSMTQAVELAQKLASPGSIVLLSPAAASFGLFQNAYDRGEQFAKAVESLI